MAIPHKTADHSNLIKAVTCRLARLGGPSANARAAWPQRAPGNAASLVARVGEARAPPVHVIQQLPRRRPDRAAAPRIPPAVFFHNALARCAMSFAPSASHCSKLLLSASGER